MTHGRTRVLQITAASLLLLGSSAAFAQVGGGGSIGMWMPTEQRVRLSDVPPAARAAAERELGNAQLTEVSEVRVDVPQRVYHFETRDAAGGRRSVAVTDDGRLVPTDSRVIPGN